MSTESRIGRVVTWDDIVKAVNIVQKAREENPERTRLEDVIRSLFAYSLDSEPAVRMLATALLRAGYRESPSLKDGIWTLTDAEFKQELGAEWEAGLRHALTWLGLTHYGDVMAKDNPHRKAGA